MCRKKSAASFRGRAVLGFHIDTLNINFLLSFLFFGKTQKTLVISLVCSPQTQKKVVSCCEYYNTQKEIYFHSTAVTRFIECVLTTLSLLLSFSFSRVSSTESALERLHDDDDVENDLSRETSTESWILE